MIDGMAGGGNSSDEYDWQVESSERCAATGYLALWSPWSGALGIEQAVLERDWKYLRANEFCKWSGGEYSLNAEFLGI